MKKNSQKMGWITNLGLLHVFKIISNANGVYTAITGSIQIDRTILHPLSKCYQIYDV